MAEINTSLIRDLREKTGAGMMDCKKALQESEGDIGKAVEWLRKKGMSSAAKRAGRAASEGVVESYIHSNGKLGVLLEVNCETDFVARTPEFQEFVKDIALHIAAEAPQYLVREEVPEAEIARERDIARTAAKESGKPDNVLDKIVDGKVEKFFQEVCLMEQKFFRGGQQTLLEMVTQKGATMGENIKVSRFARYVLGETASSEPEQE